MYTEKYESLKKEYEVLKLKKIKKVAAYCRVSTDSDEQSGSLENQRLYFQDYITKHENWELYEIFAEEGKSGTSTKNRTEFNRMISCAYKGEIDVIITKEISRFARNVLDSIKYTRELRAIGVEVIFLNDNINTINPKDEFILTLRGSIAQSESAATSERVKWGQKIQMKKGVVFGGSLLGYDVKDGKISVNKEGAEIVKRIFEKCVNEGKGTHVIARELMEEGFFPQKTKYWTNIAVLRILRNEKYCGDLVQGKTYTPDFLTHEKKKNRGESEIVIIKDHHEPIVSREVFERANKILDERSDSQTGKSKHSNRYAFSGKIKCGVCGSSYVSRIRKRKDGTSYKDWRCGNAVNHGKPKIDQFGNQVGCSLNAVRDEDAAHLMYLTLKSLKANNKKIKNSVLKTVKSVIAETSGDPSLRKLEKELEKQTEKGEKLLDIYMNDIITREEYLKKKNEIDLSAEKIKEDIQGIRSREKMQENQDKLFSDIEKAVDEVLNGVRYDDWFYRSILDKMVVVDKDTVDVYLNFLPENWRYVIADAAKDKYEVVFSDTDVPISVNNPIPMLSGMVNL
ncbi:MAG: recombinase family protein [Bacteroides sp.]|nr:recombinase family protein [Bacteroides sp.]